MIQQAKYIVVGALLFLLAPVAQAASFLLTPSTEELSVGEQLQVQVFIVPDHKMPIFTGKMHIAYSPELQLRASTSTSEEWIPLEQSPFWQDAPQIGQLVRTYGFPGGIATTTPVLVLDFQAKKAGTAVVSLLPESMLLNAAHQDISPQATTTITLTVNQATSTAFFPQNQQAAAAAPVTAEHKQSVALFLLILLGALTGMGILLWYLLQRRT